MGELIGHGGYGSVYAGHRKSDNLPVSRPTLVYLPLYLLRQ